MNYTQKVQDFLETSSDKPKMVVIYGPTGAGKTAMSILVAKMLDTEIIGTDSRQIFKELNIGTGKITENEKEGVVHHMIDIISPDREYSVGEFKREAEMHIENIFLKWKIPILCGGTGLYIDSLIYDFDIPRILADEKLRIQLEQEAEEYGNEYVWKKLEQIDPEYAAELHPNNIRYVIRAIEVKMLTGKSKTEFRTAKNLKYDVLFITPYTWDRETLYNRINTRVQMMFDEGLVDEVKDLLKTYWKQDFGMKTIGYSEVIEYLEWKMSLQECVELVQKNNRNYAKKQLTWFRKYEQDVNI